jgi:hypothetical protein
LARNDWTGVRIPVALAKKIDEYIKEREDAKVAGIFSRSELVTRIVAEWLASGYGIGELTRHMEQLEELVSAFKELERKIKLDNSRTHPPLDEIIPDLYKEPPIGEIEKYIKIRETKNEKLIALDHLEIIINIIRDGIERGEKPTTTYGP